MTKMKLEAKLEIINNLAAKKGYRKDPASFCQLCLGKDQSSNKYYMFVTSAKNANGGDKYRADVTQLKTFLKLVYLAEKNSPELTKELSVAATPLSESKNNNNAQKPSQSTTKTLNVSFKKPITSLTIVSPNEYERNFRQLISQNLRAQTQHGGEINLLHLTKLVLKGCGLRRVHKVVLAELVQLEHLDMSANRLVGASLDGMTLPRLSALVLAENEIEQLIPTARICLPRLVSLDLSANRLRSLGRKFARSFASLSQLNVDRNRIETIDAEFFQHDRMPNLIRFQASSNQMRHMPFSLASRRFEVLELNDNSFESSLPGTRHTRLDAFSQMFPSLVELSARRSLDSRLKYKVGDLPLTLIDYLNMYVKCHCGRACFEYQMNEVVTYELTRIANSFTYVRLDQALTNQLALLVVSCSLKCHNKFFRSRR